MFSPTHHSIHKGCCLWMSICRCWVFKACEAWWI